MSQLEDLMKQAVVATPQEESSFESIPDGEYIVKFLSVVYGKSKSSNKPMITYAMEVLEGDEAGRKDWKHVVLVDKDGNTKAGVFKAQLDFIFGLDDDVATNATTMDDLEDVCDAIADRAETRKPAKAILIVKSSKSSNGNVFRNQTLEKY